MNEELRAAERKHPQDLLLADPSTVATGDLLGLILNYDGETHDKARSEWHKRARALDEMRDKTPLDEAAFRLLTGDSGILYLPHHYWSMNWNDGLQLVAHAGAEEDIEYVLPLPHITVSQFKALLGLLTGKETRVS